MRTFVFEPPPPCRKKTNGTSFTLCFLGANVIIEWSLYQIILLLKFFNQSQILKTHQNEQEMGRQGREKRLFKNGSSSKYPTYSLNSGNAWYLANSSSHSCWDRGGFIPLMRCQSVMERPDFVSRVTPPKTTAPATAPEHPSNQ